MPDGLLASYLNLPLLMAALARTTGIVMFQPLIGGLAVPVRIRIMLAMALAAIVAPQATLSRGPSESIGGLTIALAGELMLGAVMGLAMRMCFVGLELAGLLIAQESGLALGQIADPSTGDLHSEISMLYLQLFTVVYLTVGGHRALVAAMLDSFQTLPLLGAGVSVATAADVLLRSITVGFELGVRVAAPVLLALFLANVAIGLMGKAVPQLNTVTVGFSLQALLAFGLMAVSLPTALNAFTDGVERVVLFVKELN